jgi:endonuclease III related protein
VKHHSLGPAAAIPSDVPNSLRVRSSNRLGTAEEGIRAMYHSLVNAWGPQKWWPARTRFEVIAGAYLTQNTAWANVELALKNLRRAQALNVSGVRRLPVAELERLIRPAGYFRQKARRLKIFVDFLDRQFGGSLDRMFAEPTESLRQVLLSLNGIGPETADAILLYAGKHPVFVVDAYTRRIAVRHGLLPVNANYEEVRELFERAINSSCIADLHGAKEQAARREALTQAFNEMHALMVGVGKRHCLKSAAHCEECPLEPLLPRPLI